MEHFTEKDLEEAVLHALMSPDFKILEFKFEKVPVAIDAYMGNHFRIVVGLLCSNSKHLQHFFAKFMPPDQDHRDYIIASNFFGKEAHFYACIAPHMNKLLPSELQLPIPLCHFTRGGSEESCTSHYCPNAEKSAIILEDLNPLGYCMPDKWMPMDLPHCRLVLRALAIFHGGSVLLQQPKEVDDDSSDPDLLDIKSIKESVFVADENHVGNRICRVAAETTASVIRKLWPRRFDSDLVYTKLLEIIWSSWKSVFYIARPSPENANVICHGDPWICNLMFAYTKDNHGVQTPLAVKLIDMQLYRFAPPATDILFFLHICTRRAFRDQHLPELLSYYYNEFVRAVSPGLAGQFLTKSSLEKSVKEMKIFGLVIAMYLIPILLHKQKVNTPHSKSVEEMASAHVGKSTVMDFLLTDRTEQILRNIKEFPEYKERVVEAYQEYLELVGLWRK